MDKSVRSVREILQVGDHDLHDTLAKAKQIIAMDSLLREILSQLSHIQNPESPPAGQGSTSPGEVRVGTLENGTLTLVTPSAATATVLRYRVSEIVHAIQVEGKSQSSNNALVSSNRFNLSAVKDIRVLVRPE